MVRNGSLSGDGGGRCVNVGHEQHNRVRLVLAVIYAPQSTLPPSSFHCIAQLVRVSLEAKGGELVADQRREGACWKFRRFHNITKN